MDPDIQTRTAIEEQRQASERGDTEAEHAIYAADAILDYPQSGERFRSRTTISAQGGEHPASRHFTVLRIVGSGNLWVSECIITYDGVPTYSVSIMEFAHGQVTRDAVLRGSLRRACLADSTHGADAGQDHRQGLNQGQERPSLSPHNRCGARRPPGAASITSRSSA